MIMIFAGMGKLGGVVCAALVVAATLIAPNTATAQLSQGGGEPINLSVSGSASQPSIAVGPNGTMHVLWWDEIDGTRYSRGVISDTASIWSKSVVIAPIVGERKTDENTKTITIRSPRRLQMLVDGRGVAHATWFDVDEKLLYSQLVSPTATNWSAPATLSPGAVAVAMTLDVSGTLQLAYVQTSSSRQSLAGVSYLNRAGNAFRRSLVYASTYFRTAKPEDISLSMARDGANNVLVAWHAAREEQSVQALSIDGGIKWAVPQPIAPRNQVFGLPVKVSVAATGKGQFLVLWRDASAPGCGLTQKRSTDAGATWSNPERVMTSLTRCPGVWSFVNGENGTLTLVGQQSIDPGLSESTGTLAVWDGTAWAQPLDVETAYKDTTTGNTRTLGCLTMALFGSNLAVTGCDSRNDIWAKGQRLQAQSLLQTSKSPWGRQLRLAGLTAAGSTNSVALATNTQSGVTYAAWSQSPALGGIGTSLNISMFQGDQVNQWGEAVELFRTEKDSSLNADTALSQTDQPSLVVDRAGKVHLAWSGGPSGRIFYIGAFERDAAIRSRWSTPVSLPAPGQTCSDPSIAADANGQTVFVLYAVPFNEGRGVYLTKSNDAGATWMTQTLVFNAQVAGWDAVDATQLTIDPATGVLHALFAKAPLPGATGTRALYYTRSSDSGASWAEPVMIDAGAIGTAKLVVYSKDALMLLWSKTNPAIGSPTAPLNVWWQTSPEGGQRWSRPVALAGYSAISGGLGLAADGKGGLYLAALGRGASDETTLLYSQWRGAVWSEPEVTSLGEPASLDNSALLAFSGISGQLVAALRAAVLQPDGLRAFATIGLNRSVNTAAVATPAPLPTFTPVPVSAAATDTPLSTPMPEVTIDVSQVSTSNGQSATPPNTLLVSAILAAVVVIVGGIVATALIRRR